MTEYRDWRTRLAAGANEVSQLVTWETGGGGAGEADLFARAAATVDADEVVPTGRVSRDSDAPGRANPVRSGAAALT